jgi:hypothetical protein
MDDRREHERYPVVVGSDIDSPGAESRFGLTQDLSRGGARLLTQTKYAEATRLKLHIQIDKSNATELTALVVRGSAVSDRGMWQYEIGVKFDELLSEDTVHTLRELSAKLGW